MAIESFKKSEIRAKTINSHSDFETTFDRGVIFWLNDVDDDSVNILEKLSKLEAPKDFNHDGIFLVDNKKVEFFFKAIEFARQKYTGKEVQFTYFNTGLNNDNETPKNGSIMPIQYLGSNILPMRVQTDIEKNTLILCSRENFEEEELSSSCLKRCPGNGSEVNQLLLIAIVMTDLNLCITLLRVISFIRRSVFRNISRFCRKIRLTLERAISSTLYSSFRNSLMELEACINFRIVDALKSIPSSFFICFSRYS